MGSRTKSASKASRRFSESTKAQVKKLKIQVRKASPLWLSRTRNPHKYLTST